MEDSSCNINATPRYMLWQLNKGKGFITPKEHGLEPPRQVFDEPIDYQAKAETGYKVMYQYLCENQINLVIKNKKLSPEKDLWVTKAIQAKKIIQELQELQKEKATKYNEKLQRACHQTKTFKEECQSLKKHVVRKDYENSLL